jgi:hypothetical protein
MNFFPQSTCRHALSWVWFSQRIAYVMAQRVAAPVFASPLAYSFD